MHVKGSRTEDVHVSVSPRDMLHALAMGILKTYGIPPEAYLDSKNELVCVARNWKGGPITGIELLDKNPSKETISVLKSLDAMAKFIQQAEAKGLK